MTRAAILIGVNKTGGLPQLFDAVNGARDMAKWALEQGMPAKNVHLFTDETGPVEVHTIRAAITSLVSAGNIEQLIIYFAGHGVNIRYGEYWLLSGAPADSSAAVNVDGSVYRARNCGIPHVVFISDACRSAAHGIQGQGVEGSVVFPNEPVPGPEQAVDMFFATLLGRPSMEVRNSANGAASYKALYTQALLEAVHGKLPGCMAIQGEVKVVRPRLLKACLSAALPQRLSIMNMSSTVDQIPDARVTSGDEAWIAKFAVEQQAPIPGGRAVPVPRSRVIVSAPSPGALHSVGSFPSTPKDQAALEIGKLLASVSAPAAPQRRGPGTWKSGGANTTGDHFPPRYGGNVSGLVVVGAKIVRCVVGGSDVAAMPLQGRMPFTVDGPAVDALVIFADGSATLVPVINGYVTSLTIDDGELADVAFEPGFLMPSPVTSEYYRTGRPLHLAIAKAARNGLFHLEGDNGRMLAAHLQQRGSIDPAIALYAAYGFHDQQMRTALLDLDRILTEQLTISFFDIGLLCKNLVPNASVQPHYVPLLPLLARGWSIWTSTDVAIPPFLIGLQRELLPSVWTHFTAAGAERLSAFLSDRRI